MSDLTLESLSLSEKLELLNLLEERQTRASRRRFFDLFPDDGPLRRDQYQKHLAFFESTREHSEVLFMAGNRCLTPWTFIETGRSTARFAEALASGDAPVRAWADGSERDAQIVGGFLKGIEPAFRLVLDSGRFFDCSRRHRVLTREGWLSLDQIVSRADGLRCWHTASGYQASCVADGYLRDPRLPWAGGSGRARPPSPDDARARRRLALSRADAEVRIRRYSHACRRGAPLTSRGDLERLSGLFAQFESAAVDTPVLPLNWSIQGWQRFRREYGAHLRRACADSPGRNSTADPARSAMQWRDSGCIQEASRALLRSGGQSLDAKPLWSSVEELSDGAHRIATFYPLTHSELIGGEHILAVVPIGYQPIIDGTVPGLENYRAAGVYHHNTGKTVAGAYAMTCHLTGRYPHWWKGRRFDEPINAWAAGTTNETTRDIVQKELFGDLGKLGTGMIPHADLIGEPRYRPNTNKSIDYAMVRHISGGTSTIGLKSYEQRRKAFEGTARQVIWLDEEPPPDIYSECLLRTTTVEGIIFITFTPLEGATEVVRSFIEGAEYRV